MNDTIEFYIDGADKFIVSARSSHNLSAGDLISIKGIVYKVLRKTFAVDNNNQYDSPSVRCNIDLAPAVGD